MRIRSIFHTVCALIAVACMAGGCSNANSSAPNLDASGKHPAGWYFDHRAVALSNPGQCYECHGSDLRGGISKVSCSTDSFNGRVCHVGHPEGWRDPLQHGAKAKAQPGTFSGFASCRNCHGTDFAGGTSGVSCFAADRNGFTCHVTNGVPVGAPHSPAPWLTNPTPSHTNTVDDAAGSNAAVCALCHRSNAGTPSCFNNTLCHGVPAGGAGHTLPYAQPSLHGAASMSNLRFCQSCHSNNPTGGAGSNPRFNNTLGRLVNGCEDCHVPFAAHPPVLQIPVVFGNISTFNPLGTPWYQHCETSPSGFDGCRLCHGATLGGGPNGASACTSCHRNRVPSTLLDCASCHGNPPNGTVYPNIAGTHPSHASGAHALPLDCPECHLDRGSVTLDHFTRAQNWRAGATSVQTGAVNFGALARSGGASPVYTEATRQCTTTYCHGTTLGGGANKSPTWRQTNYLSAGCGTCHGFPPPPPHPASAACNGCHPHVNSTNNGFTIPANHVNGAVEFGGAPHLIPLPAGGYPGSVHMYVAGTAPFSGCVNASCHTNSSANRGVYPAATAGTPPDCQGCHTKSGPIGNPTAGCYSCHGSSTNGGRPNGSAFPDISGRHSSNHGGFSCATCHGNNGTGQTTHGSSGGVEHNGVNFPVVVQFTGEAVGVTFTPTTVGHGTCSGSCHGQNHTNDNW